jgi:outer membrane protein TolC
MRFYIFKAIALLMLLSPYIGLAQQPWTESAVIEQVMEQHPTIRKAEYEVLKAKALQKTAFNPEQPTVTIETPSDVGIGLEVEQTFDFPTVYTSRSAWMKSKTSLASAEAELTRRQLVRDVRMKYLEAQVAQAQYVFFKTQDSLWNEIITNSTRLFDAGDINRADLVYSQHTAGTTVIARDNAIAQWQSALSSLQAIAATDIAAVEPLRALDAPAEMEGTYYFEPYLAQRLHVNERAIRMHRATRAPDIIVGYLRAPEPDTEYRYRFKTGISVPIFQGQYTGEIQAANYERMQTEADQALYRLETEAAIQQWRTIIEQSANSIAWYEQTGLAQQRELISLNLRLFQAGEIDYVIALRNISDAEELHRNYVELIERHNTAVIELDYLIGKNK